MKSRSLVLRYGLVTVHIGRNLHTKPDGEVCEESCESV